MTNSSEEDNFIVISICNLQMNHKCGFIQDDVTVTHTQKQLANRYHVLIVHDSKNPPTAM